MLVRVSCPRCQITVWTDDPEFARTADFHTRNCTQKPRQRRSSPRKSRAALTEIQPPLALAAAGGRR